jgi:hypothetical protein
MSASKLPTNISALIAPVAARSATAKIFDL